MRLRKLEIDWGKGLVELDLRGEGGHSLPVVGVLGPTGSGKTLLMRAAMRLFRNSIREDAHFPDWKGISASVEFDLGSGISTGVIKDGFVVQRLTFPEMSMSEGKLMGGILSYQSERGAFPVFDTPMTFAERCMRGVLHDLYKGEIRNSVIWVDDFALGLDDSLSREFLQILIKKSLERDNQLIVSADREALLQGVGSDNIRVLKGHGTNFIENLIKSFK